MTGTVGRIEWKRSFFTLLLTLAMTFVIPISMLFVAFDAAIRETVLSDYLSLNGRSVENACNTVDTYVAARMNFATRLSTNLSLKKLTGSLDENEADTLAACRELQFFALAIQSYDSIFYHAALYLPTRDLLISALNMRLNSASFYSIYVGFADLDAEAFFESVRAAKVSRFYPAAISKTAVAGSPRRVILYVQPIKIGYLTERAYFLSLIDAEAFEGLFADGFDGPVRYQILDADGAELMRSADLPAAWAADAAARPQADHWQLAEESLRYHAFASRGASSGLRFIFYIPEAAVLKRLNAFRAIWLAALAACALVGLLLARLIAGRLYAPFQSMLARIFPKGLAQAPRNMSEGYALVADELRRTHSMYQREMQSYNDAMRESMLLKLLTRGESLSAEELREAAEFCGLPESEVHWRVALIECAGASVDARELLASLRAQAMAQPERAQAMALASQTQLALALACAAGEDAPDLPRLPADARAGVSAPHAGLRGLQLGLTEASAACLSRAARAGAYAQYSRLDACADAIHYPIEKELQLIAAVRTGSFEEVRAQMNEIYAYNLEKQGLAPGMMTCLLNNLIATAFKACSGASSLADAPEQGMRLIASLGTPGMSPASSLARILSFYEALCEASRSALSGKNRSIIEKVEEYLREEYANPAMCLDMVADHFGVSYYFLSHIFKEEANRSFSDMLGGIRVDQAAELLRGTGLSVAEVSERVGYASVSTLQRAFRRHMGASPQAYRRQPQ